MCPTPLLFLPHLHLVFPLTPLFNPAFRLQQETFQNYKRFNYKGLFGEYRTFAYNLTVSLGPQRMFSDPSYGGQGPANLCSSIWNHHPFSEISFSSHSSTFPRFVPPSGWPFPTYGHPTSPVLHIKMAF